jgi:hypothetical protein
VKILEPSPATNAGDNNAWPELGSRELPDFPTAALPAPIAEFVTAIAIETQTPVDLAAMVALGVLSAVAMDGAIDCGGWTEPSLGLYFAVLMLSGELKSAVHTIVSAPLKELEHGRNEEAAPIVRELRTRAEILETCKRKLVKAAGTASDPDKRQVAEAELDD